MRSFCGDWAVTLTTLRFAAADAPTSEPRARPGAFCRRSRHGSQFRDDFPVLSLGVVAKCRMLQDAARFPDLNPLCILLYGHTLPPLLKFVFVIRLRVDGQERF